jgi:hypothetical protein
MFHLIHLVAALHPPDDRQEFRSIAAFQCDFGGGGGFTFKDGGADEEARIPNSPPYMHDDVRDLVFDSINYVTRRARSTTKTATETVTVIPGDRLVSFLEVTGKGIPTLTSIVRTPRPEGGKATRSYYSVRSYQLLMSDDGSKAWQLQGTCKAR